MYRGKRNIKKLKCIEMNKINAQGHDMILLFKGYVCEMDSGITVY